MMIPENLLKRARRMAEAKEARIRRLPSTHKILTLKDRTFPEYRRTLITFAYENGVVQLHIGDDITGTRTDISLDPEQVNQLRAFLIGLVLEPSYGPQEEK